MSTSRTAFPLTSAIDERLREEIHDFALSADLTSADVLRAGLISLLMKLRATGAEQDILGVDTSGDPTFRELAMRAGAASQCRPGEDAADPDELVDDGSALLDGEAQLVRERLSALLHSALDDPDSAARRLDAFLPGERERSVSAWNATAREVPRTTVPEWFEQRVRLAPQALAVRSGATELSYGQLNARANRIARLLLARGVGPERIVAVLLPRSDLLIIAFLAILKAGGTYLPVDPDLPAERIATMIDDAAPTLILTRPDLVTLLPDKAADPCLLLDDQVCTDRTVPSSDLTAADRHGPLTAQTPVYLLYTSGSTGRPKGVLMCAGAVINLLAWHLGTLPGEPNRMMAQYASPGFDPSIQEMLAALLSGSALVIPEDTIRTDPTELVEWLDRAGVTDLLATNTTVQALCRAALERGRPLPALSHIAQGGEAFALTEPVRAFHRGEPGRIMHNLYGPTETHAATWFAVDGEPETRPRTAPIGRPIWNTRVYVVDDRLEPLPPGFPGELCIAGDCVARGYHSRPGPTAARFLPDPFGPPGSRLYRTGDLARRRADGVLEYLGRTDDQVKIRGVRIELGEVESAIRRIPGVCDVAVVAPGDAGRRHLAAFLVPDPGAADLPAAVRARLAEVLPQAMIPAAFVLVETLPFTMNGKVDRQALLRRRLESATDLPRTAQERALCGMIAEILAIGDVGMSSSFFELGGDSLGAVALARRIRDELGIELGPGDVIGSPTVAELAARIRTAPGLRTDLTGLRPPVVPASYTQQSLWIIDQLEGPSARYNEPFALRLRGRLDTAVLRRALSDVIARHEALRTQIGTRDGAPCQRILPADQAPFDLSETHVSAADLAAALRRAARQVFTLDGELPIRARIFHLGAEEHVLLIVIHHTACDGASIGPFWRDLATAYNARALALAPTWNRLPVQYADHSLRQRARFDPSSAPNDYARRLAGFWTDALADLPEVMPLPTSRPRTDDRSISAGRVLLKVDPVLHAEVAALARAKHTTVFTVVHAAIVAMLARSGAGPDVVIGAVVSGRDDREVSEVVGHFANTVVLRVDASGTGSLSDLVDRVRRADIAALGHTDLPFEHVVDLVNPVRSMAHNPLFQVMLAFQPPADPIPPMTGLSAEAEPLDPGVAKFDLCFDLAERFSADGSRAGLIGHIDYAQDIFDRVAIERMHAEFMLLLAAIARGLDPRPSGSGRPD